MSDADQLPAAVVFDCDGTLADTETLSQRIWTEALAPYGVVPTDEDFAAVVGHAWPRSYERFSRYADLGDPDRFRTQVRAVAARVHATELRLFDDAVALLRALHDRQVPIGVASSSSAAHVRRCLAHGDLTDRVQVVVGADDVTHPKPDAEPYLRAADALAVPAAACLAIEDTVTGLTSARDAGMATVAVARGLIATDTLARIADRVVAHLELTSVVGVGTGSPGTRPSGRRPGDGPRATTAPNAPEQPRPTPWQEPTMVDPNAGSDTDEARGLMNRIVTTGAGGLAAAIVAVLIALWLLGFLRG